MPHRTRLTALLVIALLLPATPAALAQEDPPAEEPELFASPNMRHVDNISYDVPYDATTLQYGTDIEFATLGAPGEPDVARLGGPGRVQTAVAVSQDTFDASGVVLVATGGVYADALAAAPLGASLDAPVLLSTPDALSPETAAEIQRLAADRVIVLGGEAALAPQVVTDLAALEVDVERIGGTNRFGTAAMIAERLGVGEEVLIAEGERLDPDQGWQGALGASALGATHDVPLLLVNATRLPEETAALLQPDRAVTLVGNDTDVTPAVADAIADASGTVTRVGGADVFATSVALAQESIARGADGTNAYVATAGAFPDGLVAGAAVAATGGVLYLVDGEGLAGSPAPLAALEDAGLVRLRITGGTAAVAEGVETDLRALVGAPDGAREYAIAGTEYNGMQIVDITDPESAEIASVYDCGILQGDIQVFQQGDRTLATYTSENTTRTVAESRCIQDAIAAGDVDGDDLTTSYGTYVVDITDPLDPVYAGFIPVPEGSHNGTVHPTGDYFYNSDSALITDTTPQIQIYDISALPEVTRIAEVDLPVRPGLGTSSHDITFNADGTRMYSAALSQTVIYDTTDPVNPVELSSFVDPAINVEHQADPIDITDDEGNERTLLLVEDELAGAAGNGFCPGGGVHIYDITGDNELDPMLHKVGTYFIPEFRPAGTGSGQGEAITCTAHVFRIYPEQQIMTIAWYNAGVWVLDLSGLADAATAADNPIETLGYAYFDNSDTWSFKTNRIEEDGSFYGYGNDITRGLDVYRFDASVPAGEELAAFQGRFVDQATAITMADRAAIANGLQPGASQLPRCALVPLGS